MSRSIENFDLYLTEDPLDPLHALRFVRENSAGAVIYFGGTTRDSFDSKTVISLSYEAHRKMALKTFSRIAYEATQKFTDIPLNKKIHKISIGHRLGVVPVGEESIIIALTATHREEGWAAATWILEEIKKKAEIWKSEEYGDGSSTWKENETSNVR